jgi:Sucrase/ferredoxin-like
MLLSSANLTRFRPFLLLFPVLHSVALGKQELDAAECRHRAAELSAQHRSGPSLRAVPTYQTGFSLGTMALLSTLGRVLTRPPLLAGRIPRVTSASKCYYSTSTTIPAPGSGAHLEFQRSLPGTAPSHRCHVFLHSSIPPAEFSERYTTPLQRDLLLRVRRLGGIVSLAWYAQSNNFPSHTRPGSTVAFSENGGRLDISEVTSENLDEVVQQLIDHMEGRSTVQPVTREEIDVYVCTHGARDCRCGDVGGSVAEALRREAQRLNEAGSSPRIRVGEVGHVGGHK